jgi:hypothetical protein
MPNVEQVTNQLFSNSLQVNVWREVNLRHPRYSRPNAQSIKVTFNAGLKLMDDFGTLRPRADEAHLTHENIYQLWEFVHVGGPEHPPHSANSSIPRHGPNGSGGRFGVLIHGPKLIDGKTPAVLAHTHLGIKRRASGGQLHEKGGN